MAKSNNLNHGKKTEKRNKIILGSVIALILLIIVGWFIYILGVFPQNVTGAKVTGTVTTMNGETVKVNDKFSVLEANYYLSQNQYYSMAKQAGMLDNVIDETTGQTYEEFLVGQIGEQMRMVAIYNALAAKDPNFTSHADSLVKDAIAELREVADARNMTADRVLQSMYGTGMTVNVYKEIIKREFIADEYQAYMGQFVNVASDAEVLAAFEADPTTYLSANFHREIITYDYAEDGTTILNEDEVKSKADAMVAAIEGGEDFRTAAIALIGETADNYETRLKNFGYTLDEEGNLVAPEEGKELDPTLYENVLKAKVDDAGVADFIYDETRQEGDVEAIPFERGIIVVQFVSLEKDSTSSIIYRKLTLNTGVDYLNNPDGAAAAINDTVARANNLIASVDSPISFATVVKENSDNQSEILKGGYAGAVNEADMLDDATIPAWLFEEGRADGDMTYVVSDDGTTVTIYYVEKVTTSWEYTIWLRLNSDKFTEWSDAAVASTKVEVHTKRISKLIY